MFNWVLWYLIYKDDLYKPFLHYKKIQSICKYIFYFFICSNLSKTIFYVDVVVYFLNSYLYFWNTLQVVDLKHPNGWMRPGFTCPLILVLCFTCVYIGLTLLVLTMLECDHNDHNQQD